MRREDINKLTTPYPVDGTAPPDPAGALGVEAPNWRSLEREVFADLKPSAPWGIAWWDPHPGTSRRILISDQLFCCTRSVNQNLVEAALHWLEYLDWRERESDRNADVLSFVGGQPQIKMARPKNTLEAVGDRLTQLHAAGVARALSGVLDCMAGTIIGVTALPLSLLKADLGVIRDYFEKRDKGGPYLEGEYRQMEFGRKLEALIKAAGPNDWLDWLLAFRNMLIHRGRRLEVGQFEPRLPILYDHRQRPIPRVDSIMQLALDPGRSDVEVLVDASKTPVLSENASDTLAGAMESTRKLADDLGKELLEFWNWRRADPIKLPQPQKQWPKGRATQILAFGGYKPGSHPYDPGVLVSHPESLKRMLSAALEDSNRPNWATFD